MLVDDDMLMVEEVLRAIRSTLDLTKRREEILREDDPNSEDSNNPTRGIDRAAQQNLKFYLDLAFQRNIRFIAEEPEADAAVIPDDLIESDFDVAILDPIDGTDLWVRGFGNWCISTAIFSPRKARIRAAFVGYSSGDIYWATRHLVCRRGDDGEDYPLSVSRLDLSLRDAAVCFYGQKAANFLEVHKNFHVLELLRDMQKAKEQAEQTGGEAPRFRIYNLAGNPMMVRMTESDGVSAAVDAVFELKGQRVYDVVPGAFIAQRAGATLVDLSGKPIDLHDALRHHKGLMRYVLAATQDLADELVSVLKYKAKSEDEAKDDPSE